ncbi:MAG TPA: galactokinase [Chitinophagaceae bacterium]|nr:galactokinase [Chitinophagaceae bacterium]
MKDELISEFQERYGKDPDHLFFCPGRVNLIGEHIDYNGGEVLPCAISYGAFIAVSKNRDKKLRFNSLGFSAKAELQLQTSYTKTGKEWFNYPLGVINHCITEGAEISGLDMLFSGNLPVGAGLSSSASIEVLTAYAINEMFALRFTPVDLALLSQKVENNFIGVSCGIMDQFAVAMGKKEHAILLNCDSLEYEYVPFKTGNYSLVIINTKKERSLADSKYNERFAECGKALKLLKQKLQVNNLCEIDPATFELNRQFIGDAVLEKRALHVISENARVKDAVISLKTGDMEVFGKLMYASHQSLKELYEVTGKELDSVVDFCKEYRYCIGARMTGAGFGGCAIALVDEKMIGDFRDKLQEQYSMETGYSAEIFTSSAENGVSEIKF